MKQINRLLSAVLALALLVSCTIAGLALPVAAEGDTFKLAKDELYLCPTDSGGYIVYGYSQPLNMDGTPYTEALTWTSNNSALVAVNSTTGRIATVSGKKSVEGSAVITATNAAGESHSCTVYLTWDGDHISGGDFEAGPASMYTLNRWTSGILKGNVKVAEDPNDSLNHVLELPNGSSKSTYYYYLPIEKSTNYQLSFDVKGELNNDAKEIVIGYLSNITKVGNTATSGTNLYAMPVGDRWKHYSWTFTTSSSANRNYIFNLCNQNLSSGNNTNPIYIDNLQLVELGSAESVSLSASAVDMMIGEETTLSVTASPEGATFNRVKWTTSDEQVATVDKNGKVTAVGVGTATITAKSGALDAVTCSVTVKKPSATSISLNKNQLELVVDESETLIATVLPEGVEMDDELVWMSGNDAVATVDQTGKVTAVGSGSTTIIVTAGELSAICLVTVTSSVTTDTFKLAKDELFLAPTDSGGYIVYASVNPLTPDGEPYTESLTWSSSNSSLVSVNSTTGRIATASAQKNVEGSAVITATNAAGESHSCTVHVVFDGECISGGDFESSDATGMYSLNRWTPIIKSGKAKIVTEEDGNHCLEIPAGMAASYYGGLTSLPNTTYMISFDIKGDTGEIKPLYISNSTANGWKYAIPKADGWKHYSWTYTVKSSVDRSYQIALANQNITNGTNTNPIYIDNLSIVALGTAESITMNADSAPMEIGDTLDLALTASPEGATFNRPTWSSSNTDVAIVDKNGKVTAMGIGTATITAKSGTLTATCTVTVYNELLAVLPDMTVTNGEITADAEVGTVKPEDIVTVTVTPKAGYVMVPGSLKYTMKDGTVVRVLNKDLSGADLFGEGDGNTFRFVMPDEKVTLTAEFISTAEQNFAANTIGTSCRYTLDENDEKVYDGIRFLTRLNLANKFDDESNTLTVTYGGEEYTVLELGSLLKREQSAVALTYENAVANQAVSGTDKMWVSKAYTADSGLFKLVDYTESYIDFASVMMTTYYDRFYTARGYVRLQAADGAIVTLEFDQITNSISSVVPILPPVQDLDGVTAEKEYWTPVAHTVEPGQKINYTINVTAGATAGTVTVFEPIPENTVYVDGADRLVGKTAVWEVALDAGETKALTYTVQVKDTMDLCEGGTVVATDTQVGNTTVEADNTLYIERSVSKYDEYFVNNAFKALADSDFSDTTFVFWAYYVAYSNGISNYRDLKFSDILANIVNGTDTHLDIVAPTLYGGTAVSGQIEGIKGAPAAQVRESDLMIGDTLLVKNGGVTSVYVYYDDGLMKVKTTGGTEPADIALLDTLTTSQAYAVIRVRAAFKASSSTPADTEPVVLNERQEAVIKTGEAFLMRGEKVQYDDTRFGNPWGSNEYRWRLHMDAPEDASYEYIKYTNCAAFCNDSYYFGMNYALPGNMFTTFNMVNATASGKQYASIRKFTVLRSVTDEHTEEEIQATYEAFMNTVQPGDLMIVLRDTNGDGNPNDSGHVMMYIGNGKMIHSSGSNYVTDSGDTIEPSIRYGQVKDYFFNPANTNGYLFGDKVATFAVIRPFDLSAMPKTIPENTTNRLNNLTGIVAQKYTSVRPGKTLNAGDQITYTFDIRNTTNEETTLDIADTVPAGTTYVSGGMTVNGDALSATVTVPGDGKVTVSYTVSVNEGLADGTKIASTGTTVGGVAVDTPAVTVDDTLTEAEQAAIVAAYEELMAEGTQLRNFEFVNEVYKRAGIKDVTFSDTDFDVITTGEQGVFVPTAVTNSKQRHELAPVGNAYRDMVAPSLYGGMYLDSPKDQYDRTRLAYQDDLVIGDVVFRRYSSGYYVYLYVGGNNLIVLSTLKADSVTIDRRLDLCPSSVYFYAVLRPSMTMGETV